MPEPKSCGSACGAMQCTIEEYGLADRANVLSVHFLALLLMQRNAENANGQRIPLFSVGCSDVRRKGAVQCSLVYA